MLIGSENMMVVIRRQGQTSEVNVSLFRGQYTQMSESQMKRYIDALNLAKRALAATERRIDRGDIDGAEVLISIASRKRIEAARPIPRTRDARSTPLGKNIIELFEEGVRLQGRINELKLSQRPLEKEETGGN